MTLSPLPRISLAAFPEYFASGEAAVVVGAARNLPAVSRWSDEYLGDVFGDSMPKLRLGDGSFGRMPFSDFLSYLKDPSSFKAALGPFYMTDFFVNPSYGDPVREELCADLFCPLPIPIPTVGWMTLYIGPPHSSSPMHQDVFGTYTWLAQIRGEKHWRLCRPRDLDADGAGVIDAFSTDPGCPVYEAHLVPGDVMFLPPDWWHQVRNGPFASIGVSGNLAPLPMALRVRSDLRQAQESAKNQRWLELWDMILGQEDAA